MKLAAVVLAAGQSQRMGSNKLLLKVGDLKVIEHILITLKPIKTIVVTGHKPEDIQELVESLGAETVHNPGYKDGMTTSFQAGLRALDPEVEAVFMVLSDTFGFCQELLKKMTQIMERDPEVLIVSPIYLEKRGHPILFRKSLISEFLALEGRMTIRDVVNRYDDKHKDIESDIWCKIDIDTPEDYEKVKILWNNRKVV